MVCNILNIQKLLGKKWSMLILEGIFNKKSLSFNQLRNKLGRITNRVLATKLKSLEMYSLVHRKIIQEKPLLVSYSLTKKGKDYMKIIHTIKKWGVDYHLVPEHCPSTDCNICIKHNPKIQ